MDNSNSLTNILILITGVGLTALAILGHAVSERVDLASELTAGLPLWIQLSGAVTVTPVLVIYVHRKTRNTSRFDELSRLSRDVIMALNPSLTQVIALSVAAGVGEELLFRGVVQPLTGIVPASIIFAGLHTGFRFDKSALRMNFGIVFILSMFLGLIARYVGLPAAIVVHGVWDFVMIQCIRHDSGSAFRLEKSGSDRNDAG